MVGTQSIKHNQEGNVVHYHGHVAPPHVVDVSKVHFYYFNFYEFTPLPKYMYIKKYTTHIHVCTNFPNLNLNQRLRHIFIDFPPLTPDALEPKTTLSRDPPEGRWKSVLMVEAPTLLHVCIYNYVPRKKKILPLPPLFTFSIIAVHVRALLLESCVNGGGTSCSMYDDDKYTYTHLHTSTLKNLYT